jgi:ribonuclease P protein component
MPRLARIITQWHKKEIIRLFRTAKRSMVRAGLDIRLASRSNPEISRILIVIPKKVGSAPVRNLIRRRLKSLFFEKQLYTEPYDWLILVRPEAAQLSFAELNDLIMQAALQQPAPTSN